jgi:hypothetical protein
MINEELEGEIKKLKSYIDIIKDGYRIGMYMHEASDYAYRASNKLDEIIELLENKQYD